MVITTVLDVRDALVEVARTIILLVQVIQEAVTVLVVLVNLALLLDAAMRPVQLSAVVHPLMTPNVVLVRNANQIVLVVKLFALLIQIVMITMFVLMMFAIILAQQVLLVRTRI